MTWVLATAAVVGLLAIAYLVLVAWLVRQPREVFYHTFWSPVFKALNHRNCFTLYNWTLLEDPGTQLTPDGRVHEDTHVQQYHEYPVTFPFRYAWDILLHGYGCSRFEEAARKAAGEPSQCAKSG